MKYLKSINENITKKKYDSLGGWSPTYKLLDYINELIEKVNKLEERIKDLESKK